MLFNPFFIFVAGILSIFYLFILPPLVATGIIELSALSIAFAAFMLFQAWILIAEFAYESAAAAFGFKRKQLIKFMDMQRSTKENVKEISGFSALFAAFLSYFFMIYAYGVIYMFMSSISVDAFSSSKLGVVDGLYFSLVNSSTVGFGDITPKSSAAKLVVMSQIIMSMMYMIMLFSSAVSHIRDEINNSNNLNQDDINNPSDD